MKTEAAELTVIPATANLTILDGLVFGDEDTQLWMAWIDAYHHWLEGKRRQNDTGSTAGNYETAWKQFFRWGQVRPWAVTPELAERWAAFLGREGKAVIDRKTGLVVGREPLAKSTFNLKLAALGDFYNFVQKKYDLWPADRRNPFDSVDRAKVSPYGRAKYPSGDEAKAILAAINTECLTGKRDFALLYTYMVTCRRSSEILNLKWGDLKQTDDGHHAFNYRYKGGQIKLAVLNRNCYQAIVAYLKADGRWGKMQEQDYIFIPMDEERIKRINPGAEVDPNQPVSNSLVNRILKKYARRAGVEKSKAHVHGLRHAGARLRVQQMRRSRGGVDFEEVMNLLGHSSLAVTQIYASRVLDDPVDKGGQAAAEELLPKSKYRRRQKPAGEQLPLQPACGRCP